MRSTIRSRDLALLEGLTGLGNRHAFDIALEREFRRAIRDRTPLGLLMIDVDDFKTYNDMYGHQSGAVISPGQGLNSPDNLVLAADLALYRAKIAGRNRVQMTGG